MSLIRLSIAVLMMLAMALGAYVLPQRAGSGLSRTLASLGNCLNPAHGEDGLRSGPPSSEQHSEEDCGAVPSISDEDETEGDDCLLSEQALSNVSSGVERLALTPCAHDSHIADLSRRPPRVSIA